MKIDAQVFFWKDQKTFQEKQIRENKILQQSYLPEQLLQTMQRNGIDRCIVSSADPAEVETRFLAELSSTHPEINAVIGWIDLFDATAVSKIEEFLEYPSIRSYRLPIRGSQYPANAVMEKFKEYNLSLDLWTGNTTDYESLSSWLKSYPEQVFLLANSGEPDARQSPAKEWESGMSILSENPNLYCKVSGIFNSLNPKSWKPADIYPFLEILFKRFGINRMVYSSDWPFLLLSGMYVQWKSLLEKFTEHQSEEDRDLFFGENASRLYRL